MSSDDRHDSNVQSDISRLHSEWEEIHVQLREMEQVLSQAIELYARGQAARPDHMIGEIEGLRAICAQRFQALMAAMKR